MRKTYLCEIKYLVKSTGVTEGVSDFTEFLTQEVSSGKKPRIVREKERSRKALQPPNRSNTLLLAIRLWLLPNPPADGTRAGRPKPGPWASKGLDLEGAYGCKKLLQR